MGAPHARHGGRGRQFAGPRARAAGRRPARAAVRAPLPTRARTSCARWRRRAASRCCSSTAPLLCRRASTARAKSTTRTRRAAAAWRDVSGLRRAACAVEAEPGSPLDAAQPYATLAAASSPDAGFTNFAVLTIEVDAIDWLWLGPQDMRRARFAWIAGYWSPVDRAMTSTSTSPEPRPREPDAGRVTTRAIRAAPDGPRSCHMAERPSLDRAFFLQADCSSDGDVFLAGNVHVKPEIV